MRRLLLASCFIYFGLLGFSQTCPNYAVSIADVRGSITNDFYSLGTPNGQGTVFSKGPSGPYTRVVWDLGHYVDSGTTVCFRIRVNSCAATSSSVANYSIWLAPDGVTPHNSPYTLQGYKTANSSSWTTVCVNTVSACRYFKISDGGECSFEIDNISYNYGCGVNTIDGHVWEDIDYDQNIDGSELMASNKKVYLYRDQDKDGEIDVNENSPMDSTYTDSSGFYAFTRPFDDEMSYVIRKINSSANDADEISGSVNIGNSYADFSTENSGFRFTNIAVPKNAIIQKAYMTYTASNTNTSNTTCTIKGHDAGNSGLFSNITNGIGGRTATSSSVSWAVEGVTQYNGYTTADVSDIVQEIVDRTDWNSGNAMSLLFYGGGGSSKGAYMYDGNSTYAPTLVIAYVDSTDEYYNVAAETTSLPEATVMSTDNKESAGFNKAGLEDTNNDFGYTPPNVISGKVFYDKNRNGITGSNTGQPGVTVYLLENVDSASLMANVNDSSDLTFYGMYEKFNDWKFRVKNNSNSPAMWTVTVANANYELDTEDIDSSHQFTFTETDHGDDTYTYVFEGKEQLAPGDKTSMFAWTGDDFANNMNSDGFELDGVVALDTAFENGIVATAITNATGDYTVHAPYTGGTDTFYITTAQPTYGDQIDLTTSNFQSAMFSEGGNIDANNDYGFNGSLTISGFVFNDANADSVKQKSEIGEEGVDMYLYEDANNNDILDSSEMTVLETATTNASGKYVFKDYFYGDSMSYIVTSELSDYPHDVSVTTDNTEEATFITFNQEDNHNDFGFVEHNAITGTVYVDEDQNQVKGGGEAGTVGVTVYLYSDENNNGVLDPTETTPIDSIITDVNGEYMFDCFYTGGTMSYIINVDTNTLPLNSSLTTDNIEVASFTEGGNTDNSNDFGHSPCTFFSGISSPAAGCESVEQLLAVTLPISGATYAWTFENGSPSSSTAENQLVSWLNGGTKDIDLTISKDRCTELYQTTIDIDDAVVADLTVTGGAVCSGAQIVLDADGSDPSAGGNLMNFVWSKDGSPIGSNQDSLHQVITGTSTHVYQVIVTDDVTGCTDTAQVTKASNVCTSDITGRVWFDEDGNQSIGTSEFGQISTKVYLIDDANGDGLRTAGESILDSANTEFGGYYGFTQDYVSGTYNYVLVTDTLTYPVGAAQSTDDVETASFSTPNQTDANNNFGFGVNNCSGAADNVVENTTGESPFNVVGASDGNMLRIDNGEYVTFDMVDTLNIYKEFDLVWQGGSTGTNTVEVYQSVDLVTWVGPITVTASGTNLNTSTVVLTDSARFIRIASANASTVDLDGMDYDCTVAPVPVEFIGVNAELLNKDDVLVSWSTATEINNDYFEIQRRYEYETEFRTIGTTPGAGTSNQKLTYTYIDNANRWLSPVLYYRIKQVDFDGQFDFSYVVVVSKNDELEVLMYPNPAEREATVAVLTDDKNTTLQVLDVLGNDLTGQVNLTSERNIYTIDVTALRIGTYILQITTENNRINKRFIVTH